MAVEISMSARVKILFDCNDQRKAISAYNFLGYNLSLYFSKNIAIVEVSSAAGSLFIVSCCVNLLVAVNQHGVPVSSGNTFGLNLDGNHSGDGDFFIGKHSKSTVFCVSPTVYLAIAGYGKIKVSS